MAGSSRYCGAHASARTTARKSHDLSVCSEYVVDILRVKGNASHMAYTSKCLCSASNLKTPMLET